MLAVDVGRSDLVYRLHLTGLYRREGVRSLPG